MHQRSTRVYFGPSIGLLRHRDGKAASQPHRRGVVDEVVGDLEDAESLVFARGQEAGAIGGEARALGEVLLVLWSGSAGNGGMSQMTVPRVMNRYRRACIPTRCLTQESGYCGLGGVLSHTMPSKRYLSITEAINVP